MASDGMLNAQPGPTWMDVLLRARAVRYDTLAVIAEVWRENPDLVTRHLDLLAEHVERRGAGWDAAVDDAEGNWQMDEADVRLDETQALQLADELRDAAGRTLAARLRANAPIPFPQQPGTRAA